MRFPATPGWVSLPVVVGVPRHSWLRAPGAVLRHSWLGSAGRGGVWSLVGPGCGSWLRLPATPGWGLPPGVVGGPSPLPAEGRGRCSPPLLARVPRLWWWGLARHSRLWAPGCPSRWPWCVCVCCVAPGVAVGGVRRSCAVWLLCVGVCECVRCVVCGVCHTWFGSRRWSTFSRPKSRKRGPVDV